MTNYIKNGIIFLTRVVFRYLMTYFSCSFTLQTHSAQKMGKGDFLMIEKILIALTAAASLAFAPSALAEVAPGADSLLLEGETSIGIDFSANSPEPVEKVVTPVAAEPKQVTEEAVEAPTTEWDASEWTVVEESETLTVNPTLALTAVEPVAPVVEESEPVVAVVELTPIASEQVEAHVVVEPEAPTVAQVQYPEATTPISPSPLPVETGYDRQVEVWAEAQTDFAGESMVTSTVTIPVGETGEIKVGGAVGNSSSEGESTDWNSQSIAVIGRIAEWDRGELYGHVTLNRSAYSGATSDGAYSWDGESFDVWTGVTAEHRPENFTLRLDAGISPITGEGDIQGDATWHIGSDVHLTGSIGTRGRSLQIEATPRIFGVQTVIGANTVRPAGEEQSYQTVYYGVDLGAFRITHNTRNQLNVGVGFTF